ncbi:MAG: hypothetical protein MUE53_02565 [Chitinophagales bacterium]|jgi:hypothetical protein|nr:hypothetical protein [Chitinophagales bacterium]
MKAVNNFFSVVFFVFILNTSLIANDEGKHIPKKESAIQFPLKITDLNVYSVSLIRMFSQANEIKTNRFIDLKLKNHSLRFKNISEDQSIWIVKNKEYQKIKPLGQF